MNYTDFMSAISESDTFESNVTEQLHSVLVSAYRSAVHSSSSKRHHELRNRLVKTVAIAESMRRLLVFGAIHDLTYLHAVVFEKNAVHSVAKSSAGLYLGTDFAINQLALSMIDNDNPQLSDERFTHAVQTIDHVARQLDPDFHDVFLELMSSAATLNSL